MRVLVQRSLDSSVSINENIVGKIDKGLVLLVGFTDGDNIDNIKYLVNKVINLRVFDDEFGVMNKSILEVGGSILSISQFTLYADCKHGNRPSFTESMGPQRAEELYNYIADSLRPQVKNLGLGVFGADMQVSLINDGPFTVILDSAAI